MESTILKETKNMSYEDKMLYAFVGKPDKFYWYKKAFVKYNVNGIKNFAWNWSWYAFFFSFWYLLYRKVYAVSTALFLAYIFFGAIGGLFGLILNIILGGTLPYFIYDRYEKKKKEIEKHISDKNLRVETMAKIGGTNGAIIYLTIAFIIFLSFIISIYFTSLQSLIIISR